MTADGTIVGAHSNQLAHGKGKGHKAHDIVAYLCHRCHLFVDQTGAGNRDARRYIWRAAAIRSVQTYWHLLDQEGRDLATQILEVQFAPGGSIICP